MLPVINVPKTPATPSMMDAGIAYLKTVVRASFKSSNLFDSISAISLSLASLYFKNGSGLNPGKGGAATQLLMLFEKYKDVYF